eukprot:Skav223406  [mRNA]  locus=scaffold350:5013:19473:- [translate_table: standard]
MAEEPSETTDAELWFQLFLRSCWPPSGALLAFAEGTTTPVGIDWRQRMQVRMESTPTIVVDMGRGYTKFTVVHGVRGRWEFDGHSPQLVQLCSSPTHPPDCDRNEQLSYIHHRLDRSFLEAATDPTHRLHKTALGPQSDLKARPTSGNPQSCAQVDQYAVYRATAESADGGCKLVLESNQWRVEPVKRRQLCEHQQRDFKVSAEQLRPMRRAHDLPILIGEPFVITASRGRGNDSQQSHWDANIRAQLGNDRPGAVQVVSQAQMALWAHGLDHGIVVNIGQQQTMALPVVRGLLLRVATRCWEHDFESQVPVGGAAARLAAGDDFGIRPVPVELPSYARGEASTLELAEDWLPPEYQGTYTQEDIRDLLRNVVLVGGAADFPGIRPRVEYEMRNLLQKPENQHLSSCCESTDDVYVLNPPLDRSSNPLVSPRFVPLFGGCVRAASSAGYGALERDKNTGALRSLPLQAEDLEQAEEGGARRALMWQRRISGMLALQLPNIFRTGGGGGEDDQVWQELLQSDDDDEMGHPSESASRWVARKTGG